MTLLTERSAALGDVTLRYLMGGTGPPLVLCHGFMGSAENFAKWTDQLAQRRTLIIPDLPGCGGSAALSGRHTAAALGRTVHELVDELGIERFELGGLCLGASVACAVARLCPDRVERLILHTPLLAPSLIMRRFRIQARVLTAPGVFPAVHWLGSRRWVSDLYKRKLVEGDDVDPVEAETNFKNQVRANPRAIREWLRDGMSRRDLDIVAGRSRPTLLLVPADDSIADVSGLRIASAAMPAASLAVIEESGHGWNDDTVARQLAVIIAFLEEPKLPAVAGA